MQNNNAKRSRGRGRKPHSGGTSVVGGGGGGGGGNPNRTIDSNGPDIKIRGTAYHIHEKYQNLARDAHSSGDYVAAENYLQHAEHYFRLLAAIAPAQGLRDGQVRNGTVNGGPSSGNGPDGDQPDDSGMGMGATGRIEVGPGAGANDRGYAEDPTGAGE